MSKENNNRKNSIAQNEVIVKDIFEFISELDDLEETLGQLIDDVTEAYSASIVKPILDGTFNLSSKQANELINSFNSLIDKIIEAEDGIIELNEFADKMIEKLSFEPKK